MIPKPPSFGTCSTRWVHASKFWFRYWDAAVEEDLAKTNWWFGQNIVRPNHQSWGMNLFSLVQVSDLVNLGWSRALDQHRAARWGLEFERKRFIRTDVFGSSGQVA
jgi:hypothetical protein